MVGHIPAVRYRMIVDAESKGLVFSPMTMSTASLTDEAHRQLRDDIIHGRIRPNQRLIAADLAERLKISRTPIREALQLLAAEGLVVGVKRGYMVREHTADEVREIYEVRAALEGMAAKLAAERGSDESIAEIEKIGAHEDALASAPRAKLVELNKLFHDAIVASASNARLGRVNQRNSEHFFNYKIAELYSDAEALVSVRGHARVIEAIKSRDGSAANTAAQNHVIDALGVTLSKLR